MPLKEQKIDGREALVAYLKTDPVTGGHVIVDDEKDADVVKVVFLDNGDRAFLVPNKD